MNNYERLITDRIIDSPCYDDEKMDILLNEIGSRIKAERIKQGLTTQELVAMSGLNTTHLYRIERGTKPVGLRALIKISFALNKPIEFFVPFERQPEEALSIDLQRFQALTQGFDEDTMEFVFDALEHLRNNLDAKKDE